MLSPGVDYPRLTVCLPKCFLILWADLDCFAFLTGPNETVRTSRCALKMACRKHTCPDTTLTQQSESLMSESWDMSWWTWTQAVYQSHIPAARNHWTHTLRHRSEFHTELQLPHHVVDLCLLLFSCRSTNCTSESVSTSSHREQMQHETWNTDVMLITRVMMEGFMFMTTTCPS